MRSVPYPFFPFLSALSIFKIFYIFLLACKEHVTMSDISHITVSDIISFHAVTLPFKNRLTASPVSEKKNNIYLVQ